MSGLTRAAGVVLTAKPNVRLKHIEFVRLEPERALGVLVAEDGQVENRILNMPAGLPTLGADRGDELSQCAHPRQDAWPRCSAELERALEAGRAELDQLTQKIVAAGPCQLVGRRRARSAS